MLDIKQIKLPSDILLVEEHPVIVQETIGGVHRDPEEIKREKSMRLFRTGTVVSSGIINKEILTSFSTTGNSEPIVLDTLIGQTVLYMVHGVNVVDIPVERTKRLVSINASYLFSLIGEE